MTTNITPQTISYLASLSAIRLTDEEKAQLQTDIENILGYIEQLNELDTDAVEPTYQVSGRENVWRDDIADATNDVDVMAAAPEATDHQFKIPQVL